MLSKINRLTKERDFAKVAQFGRSLVLPFLVIRSFKRGDEPFSRFGFVVSKRISKLAPRRNYLKRIMREIVRGLVSDISTGYDFVFIARQPIKSIKFLELKESIYKAFKKMNLLSSEREK
ncbi:MAG: ribonuclease P protein component [Patescibacteria group bacterium]